MNRELEHALITTYPATYWKLRPRFSGGSRFDCDDGWYPIIDELSGKLESAGGLPGLRVIEVRDQLGTLRFRLEGEVTSRMASWIAEAQRLSQRTCGRCGQPAMLRGHEDGRVRTLCPTCAAALDYVRE
ncbi:hypothetical protein WN982_19230 [Paraburkholderia sp. IMGN_8]|uniref:hypothetical protein n=1 Tax=Paraburkholderia sp. IMGN_8 TaxID=3136564 RepID=UPI0031011643